MGAKSPATSAATCILFLTGAAVDAAFLSLVSLLRAGAFGLFAGAAFAGAAYVAAYVPETRGRTLVEVQAMLAGRAAAAAAAGGGGGGSTSGGAAAADVPGSYVRWRGWDWGRGTALELGHANSSELAVEVQGLLQRRHSAHAAVADTRTRASFHRSSNDDDDGVTDAESDWALQGGEAAVGRSSHYYHSATISL